MYTTLVYPITLQFIVYCLLLNLPEKRRGLLTGNSVGSIWLPFLVTFKRVLLLHQPKISAFIDHYNTTLQDILNKNAPEKTKVITVRASAPWYSDKIDAGKKLRRKLERRWRKTKSLDHYNVYLLQCRRVQLLISSSKFDYYTSIIDENRANQKALYKIMDHLLNRKATPQLPSLPRDDLPGKFATFFSDKIVSIRNGLSTYDDDDHLTIPAASTLLNFVEFNHVTLSEIEKLINYKSSPTKSCVSDPLPTSILKECVQLLLPAITNIVNLSLSSSTIPQQFKDAVVTPILKKASLNPEILKNYRPVSNLPYISKIVEKAASLQISSHLEKNDLSDIYQSAHKKQHSIETALVRVQNDLLMALDSRCLLCWTLALHSILSIIPSCCIDCLLDLVSRRKHSSGSSLTYLTIVKQL